ncbi:MAG: sugar phosphate isomerase/epimerase family protein [Candidatus Bathyarchaeia archaeon]
MRFSFVVSPRLGFQIPNLFSTPKSFQDFRTALKLLRECGFEGVELNLNSDKEPLLSRISGMIEEAELKVAAVGTGLLYSESKVSFTDPQPAKRGKAVSVFKGLVKFASAFQAPVIIGLVRGVGPVSNERTAAYLQDCLTQCDAAANKSRVRLALEALNRYETQSLNTAKDVVEFIDQHQLNSTGLLLDSFHMNIEEEVIENTLDTYASRIVHFHIADSNRWPPGYGHLNVHGLLNRLEAQGYDGWVSSETLPRPTSVEAVKATADYLTRHGYIRK